MTYACTFIPHPTVQCTVYIPPPAKQIRLAAANFFDKLGSSVHFVQVHIWQSTSKTYDKESLASGLAFEADKRTEEPQLLTKSNI